MTCERYWREGVVLYERGEADAHRDECVECREAHAACLEMIRAMPLVGDDVVGDPLWKSKVLDAIDAREAKARTWRWTWWLNGAFAGAAAIVLVWLLVGHKPDVDEIKYGTAIESGAIARRGSHGEEMSGAAGGPRSANVGDAVTITAHSTEEVRVYRANKLILRCPTANEKCKSDDRSVTAHAVFDTAGDYQLIVITPPTAEPIGDLDKDLAAVVSAGGDYKLNDMEVR